MRSLKSASLGLLVLALVAAAADTPTALSKDLKTALATIKPMDGYEYTRALASRQFAGRLTGTEGYSAAAQWASRKFADWHVLTISATRGHLQAYPSPVTVVDKAEMALLLPEGQGTKEMKLLPEKDFMPLLFTASGEREGGLVFAGWGISAPDLNYDDYAGLDVKGKFVLCFRGTPDRDRKWQVHDEHRTRMKVARDKGALGIVYIYPEVNSHPNGDWLADFTPAMVSETAADAIFKEVNGSAAELRKTLTTYKRPVSFPLQAKARVAFFSRHFPDAVGYNVVGWVEGSDPKLRREVVVLGGHFDHTGTHMGLLFPGADDNASGSAAVMEVAQAFASLGRKPKRSVAFVLFGGEELGLQGSTWFAGHVPVLFTKVDAMFNFDMVGEGDGLGGAVSDFAPDFKAVIEAADLHVGILRRLGEIRNVGVRGSDFAPFHLQGIPSASLGSNGPHLAYHQTGDTIYRINPDIIADAARLAFLAAFKRADR
jgi:Peptidase family M28